MRQEIQYTSHTLYIITVYCVLSLTQLLFCFVCKKKKNYNFDFAVEPRWHSSRRAKPEGLPDFNSSQSLAVAKALNNTFTIIQGPPGKRWNLYSP